MKVSMIAHTENGENVVVAAAKVCYSSKTLDEIVAEAISNDVEESYIGGLVDRGHESPLEHLSFTFAVEGISRACLAQLTRHRIASYSVRSQRYVKSEDFEYITPPDIKADESLCKAYDKCMENAFEEYLYMTSKLETKYKADGLSDRQAEKKAIEDARFLFPNATSTQLVMTMNARSLLNFFKLRCCNHAQWEIRDLAWEMLKQCKEVAPNIFKNAGPSCVRGGCPEGKFSCKQPYKK